jgi:hypothetical protein
MEKPNLISPLNYARRKYAILCIMGLILLVEMVFPPLSRKESGAVFTAPHL